MVVYFTPHKLHNSLSLSLSPWQDWFFIHSSLSLPLTPHSLSIPFSLLIFMSLGCWSRDFCFRFTMLLGLVLLCWWMWVIDLGMVVVVVVVWPYVVVDVVCELVLRTVVWGLGYVRGGFVLLIVRGLFF